MFFVRKKQSNLTKELMKRFTKEYKTLDITESTNLAGYLSHLQKAGCIIFPSISGNFYFFGIIIDMH